LKKDPKFFLTFRLPSYLL